MKTKLKISVLPAVALLSLFMFSGVAMASEVTGNLSTGLNSTVGDTVNGVVIAPPTPSPAAGTYTSAQSVTLTAPGASSINYTTDGTLPTCTTGTVYSGAIAVNSSLTIQAISCYPSANASTVAANVYTINIPAPAPVSSGGGGGGGGGVYSGPSSYGYVNTTSAPQTTTVSTTPAPSQGQVLGAAAYNFTTNLTVGSTGADVTQLQQFLTTDGEYTGPVTGYFGALTKAAVAKFQKAHGLAQVGIVGPQTRTLLNNGTTPTTPEVLGASAYNFTTNLTVGSTGADVTALQNLLTKTGDYAGPVTGYFGVLTKAAVQKYQTSHNVSAVGSVGPMTRAALNKGI